MSEVPAKSNKHEEETVSLYIGELQHRFPLFTRAHQDELRVMKHDWVARLFSEYVVFGEKNTYEGMLQGILTDAERQRLQTDPKFTRAWQIFVDLCWLKKQLMRGVLILAGIILMFALILLLFWALPRVAGPHR